MKKLKNYAVKTTNSTEWQIAVKFFQRCSKRPVNLFTQENPNRGIYVGMDNRTVAASDVCYDHETIIPFENLCDLVDTPHRSRVYKKVFGYL